MIACIEKSGKLLKSVNETGSFIISSRESKRLKILDSIVGILVGLWPTLMWRKLKQIHGNFQFRVKSNNTDTDSFIKDTIFEFTKDCINKLNSKVTNNWIFIEVSTIKVKSKDNIIVTNDRIRNRLRLFFLWKTIINWLKRIKINIINGLYYIDYI